jgi:hypothetical protein
MSCAETGYCVAVDLRIARLDNRSPCRPGDGYAAAWEEGLAMTVDQAVAYALDQPSVTPS